MIMLVTNSLAAAALIGTGMLLTQPVAPPFPEIGLTAAVCPADNPQCTNYRTDRATANPARRPPTVAAGADAARAAVTANQIADLFYLFGNGTPERPNAGLLVGDGYSFTENDVDVTPYCVYAQPCNGGNAGLLFGKGGNGFDGGSGGNAYFYGTGGNGGNALDDQAPGEPFAGGNGGHGGIFGGTSADGTLFRGGGGSGGNGINNGRGGDGGNAGYGLDLIPALIERIAGVPLDFDPESIPVLGPLFTYNIISLSGGGGKAGNGGDGTAKYPDGGAGGNAGDSAQLPTFDPGVAVQRGGNGGAGGLG